MNIPDEAVEAASKAWDKHMGGRYAPHEVEELAEEVRVILEAALPYLVSQARAEGWDVCSRAVEAATRLVAPDHITPMGQRMIIKAANNNPYTQEKE